MQVKWYHVEDMDAPESPWGTSPYLQAASEGHRSTWKRWVAVGAGALVLIGAGYGGYLYLNRPLPLPVTVAIESEPLVPGSTSLLTVTVTNSSVTETAFAGDLAITLPQKTISAGLADETASSTVAVPMVSIGNLAPGDTKTVTLTLTTELDPNSAVPVSAKATYHVAKDANKRFEASAQAELLVSEPAATVSVEAPPAVVRDAPFSATIRYRNNTEKILTDAAVTLVLPRGLAIASSSPALAGNVLELPTISAKQGGTIRLTLIPGVSAPHEMPMRAELIVAGELLAERTATVKNASDSLAVTVVANGSREPAVELDQGINYDITVKNLSKVTLQDVQVKARLEGSLFVLSSVRPQDGSLSAKEPVVTWNGVGIPQLRAIEPGGTVALRMSLKLAKTVGSATSVTAPVTVTASSPTTPPGVVATGVTATDTATAKLAAVVGFTSLGYWRDPLGQITNTGPQPPQVGRATQYAIRWSVKANAAPLKETVVSAQIEPGIKFTGKLGGVTTSTLNYDPNSGIITWRPGAIAANATARAAFQLEVTPSVNQRGKSVKMLNTATLQAIDAFTNKTIKTNAGQVTTNLSSELGDNVGVVR